MALQVVLIGPPACGKGTQGRHLAEATGAAYFSTGKQLRREMEAATPLGREAVRYLDAGQYVPDTMAQELAFHWLRDVAGGWILDGFPRTLAQARELDRFLGAGRDVLQAVLLDVPAEELEERVTHRRECLLCSWVGTRGKAETSGNCPVCGGGLRSRADDAAESFRMRMAVYDELTRPVIDHYVESARLRRVSGLGTPGEVYERMQSLLELS